MTLSFQEILEGITRHRANPINVTVNIPTGAGKATQDIAVHLSMELTRKINEIEWALQALAEKLRDESNE